MKKFNILLLLAFAATIYFQSCKTKEKITHDKSVKTLSNQITNSDIITNKKLNNPIVAENKTNDTINPEKIPVLNPKIHSQVLIMDEGNVINEKENNAPTYKTSELSNFNLFLETMYPGVKWKHYDNEDPYESYNVFAAYYKGTHFFHENLNSFVYYFYDFGEISHANIIKTAVFWVVQPEYQNIEIYKTELYKQDKDKEYDILYRYYYTTGKVNGEDLEVYTIFWNDQLHNFKALKNKINIKYGLSFD